MVLTLILGFIFAEVLIYARLNRFDTISGLAMWEDLTVAKAISIAIGVGALLVYGEVSLGMATFHVKPLLLGGVILGGLVFGIGMAILGYCPGTLFVSAGEGAVDALVGIFGGLVGGLLFTLSLPVLKGILGPNLGKPSILSLLGGGWIALLGVLLFSLLFVAVSFYLHRLNPKGGYRWAVSGLLLALLEALVFHKAVSNRPIGASTSYPYLADLLFRLTSNPYFNKIARPGAWEVVFLSGAFLGALLSSIVRGEFRLKVIHENWRRKKGESAWNRIIWAFIGGFVLIFGARMAGGCTSGHILSGGIQTAISSLLFMLSAFTGLLITGKAFYGA